MKAVNHNGGPPDLPLTAKTKLECIQGILERDDLTAAQKCVGAGIVLEADREWIAEVKTPTLQRYASVKDRETVFRATRELDKKAVISKSSARGQAGKFTVLPPRVVTAIVEAFNEAKSSPAKPDHNSESGRVKPDGITSRVPTSEPVGFEPTSQDKPVGFEPTPRAHVRARIETPSGLLFPDKINTPLPPKGPTKADALAAFNAYNETALRCGLPQAKRLTPDRERSITARLKDYGLEGWLRALGNIEKSAFLTGSTDHGFRADLEFVCQAKKFGKLHDGGYGNGRHAAAHREQHPAEEIDYDALRREAGVVVHRGRGG